MDLEGKGNLFLHPGIIIHDGMPEAGPYTPGAPWEIDPAYTLPGAFHKAQIYLRHSLDPPRSMEKRERVFNLGYQGEEKYWTMFTVRDSIVYSGGTRSTEKPFS